MAVTVLNRLPPARAPQLRGACSAALVRANIAKTDQEKVTDRPRHLVDYAERRETAHSATHEEVGHGET